MQVSCPGWKLGSRRQLLPGGVHVDLVSPGLGLGLSTLQLSWVLALFLWVRLSMPGPVGLPAGVGLRFCRAGREQLPGVGVLAPPKGDLPQLGEGELSSHLLPLHLFKIFLGLYHERSSFHSPPQGQPALTSAWLLTIFITQKQNGQTICFQILF